jgi:hypothetical protein
LPIELIKKKRENNCFLKISNKKIFANKKNKKKGLKEDLIIYDSFTREEL